MPSSATSSAQLEALYISHHSWLCGWLRRKLGNGGDAADIAQDTFIRVHLAVRDQDLAGLREPRAYLTTVAKRLVVNHFERKSLEQAYLDSLRLLPQASVPSEQERAILLETLQELDRLLGQLPDKVRTAFLMSQLEGAGYEEIASHLQVTVRTVTRYMAQAFRQCLQWTLAHPV